MSKKQKISGLVIMILLALMAVAVVMFTMNFLWPEAKVGVMTVESSDKTIKPVSNILEIVKKDENSTGTALVLSDIAATLPEVIYDGDIAVNYSLDTMDDFSFDMYDSSLKGLYTGSDRYVHPETAGTYIVRIVFSWGSGNDNKITTENFFKVTYEKDLSEYSHEH